jgi:EAL domain-containing protein (putative c-di-GMP-specific phosphodiesterase class I)
MTVLSARDTQSMEYLAVAAGDTPEPAAPPASRKVQSNWHKRLIEGLEDNQFQLHRQRIVSLQPDVILPLEHYEVLLRLNTNTRGMVAPAAFMPAARRLRLLQEIDRWVIQAVFEHAGTERRAGLAPINYAINLSGAAIGDEGLLLFILEQFAATDADPNNICFEFTETVAVRHLRRAQHLISVLKERGCAFSLDDFGQGLSSLTHLKHLSVNYLKIDGSFVKNLAADKVDFAIVEAIHRMAAAMELKTIAEYAENDAIIDKLRIIGVDYAQGYRIHKPEPFGLAATR